METEYERLKKQCERMIEEKDIDYKKLCQLKDLCIIQLEFEIKKLEGYNDSLRKSNEWISINKKTPTAYETGAWDGKRSDFVLVECRDERYFVCRAYENTMDGNYFLEFWDDLDFQVTNIIRWKYI